MHKGKSGVRIKVLDFIHRKLHTVKKEFGSPACEFQGQKCISKEQNRYLLGFSYFKTTYASMTSPVVLFNSCTFPPLASMAALALAVNACAWTVISFAVKSPFPATTL